MAAPPPPPRDAHVLTHCARPMRFCGASAMLQIVFWMGVLEFWTNKGNVTMETMFSDPDREPGNLGFDPMGLAVGKTEDEMNDLKLKELKNGRLAMLAIGDMIHHNWITGEALF